MVRQVMCTFFDGAGAEIEGMPGPALDEQMQVSLEPEERRGFRSVV